MMFIQNHFWEDFALDLTGFNMLFHKCHVMISHRGDFNAWDSPPGLDPWLYFLEKKLVNVCRKTYGKTYGLSDPFPLRWMFGQPWMASFW
jgi:hypothetical protein